MTMTSRAEFLSALPSVIKYVPASDEEAAALVDAFPNVEPGVRPYGQRVLVQIRLARRRTASGLYLPGESQDTEKWNTGIAQVIMLGPLAFRKRDTLQLWGEGQWTQVGDYVRAPKFGGDRWEVPIEDKAAMVERAEALARVENSMRAADLVNDHAAGARLYQEQKSLKTPTPPLLIMFAMFNDFELIGEVVGNPVAVRVYI